ncbi:TetR/AcrR family transcriptional regulator [Kribbella turkmenica]|uniref:TetR/AcrR family transcriptional regulator n=1 Tax=Kribbella turkmenica TaxID=2530375 RepID=A0A4R4WWC1_9ACTN|nr:TetR family transcriptional regulator [Kribbella turkmenica]TDD22059.1 TetR/AcrR family transcriptional regulator [Kribbella turkmenica]
MRANPERRTALVDAAIEVLAADGARGLTFRSVDVTAGVPNGTTSNYFSSRDDLLLQSGLRVHDRLGADSAHLGQPPSPEFLTSLPQLLRDRLTRDRAGYLALLELRLEATRRPALQEALAERVRANLDENIRLHREHGLPGDPLLFYLTIGGFMLEQLTLPGVLPDGLLEKVVEHGVRGFVGGGP